jgi:hypothetical protein
MKQLEVFNKIGGILKELNEQYQYIQTDPEIINDLEMELFVANAHFLTDHAEILNKLNQRTKAEKAEETRADIVGTKADGKLLPPAAPIEIPERIFELPVKPVETPKPVEEQPKIEIIQPEPVKFEVPVKAEAEEEPIVVEPIKPVEPVKAPEPVKQSFVEKFFEPLVQKPKRPEPVDPEPEIDLSSDTPKDSYSFIMEPPEVIRHELEIDPDDDFSDDNDEEIVAEAPVEEEEEEIVPEPVKAEVKEEPKPEIKIEPKPVEKKEEPTAAKDEVLTINQRMSAQRSGSTSYTEQAAQPVTNLKAAITLNDKLIFIKDLFNGYSLAYSEAIEILNRFNTFEEANRFLSKNYTAKNNWDSKPETSEKFYALLKRRYES